MDNPHDDFYHSLPGRFRSDVLEVLADVRRTVREISELSLRAGIVSVGELRRRGHDLRIGRVRITDRYSQAIADGNALAAFDTMLKDDDDTTITRPAEVPRPGGPRSCGDRRMAPPVIPYSRYPRTSLSRSTRPPAPVF
jgi:hypothetical protein